MRIAVTGATGFVGRHVVAQLLDEGCSVLAIARNSERSRLLPWIEQVDFLSCNLHEDFRPVIAAIGDADVLLHLAWSGLPNYRNFFHISQNLKADLTFLPAVMKAGIEHLLVTGTCLEYGMQYGPLLEDMETKPSVPYALAKDMLRKSLQALQKEFMFKLQWVRLFYMFGDGQNPNSLLAQLDNAIASGQTVFNMSLGDQLRDYMPVTEVASAIVKLVHHPEINGVINCCSGRPVSILDLVTERCQSKGSNITLNRGYYPYPDYEPMAFWGVPDKLNKLGVLVSKEMIEV